MARRLIAILLLVAALSRAWRTGNGQEALWGLLLFMLW